MPNPTRRQFCQSTLAGAAALGGPAIATASKTNSGPVITGVDGYRYQVNHHWAQLPEQYTWQTTHNVAVDSQGVVYVIHQGVFGQADHPSIFVFDQAGRFVRAFGQQFQGGGHGIETRVEGSEEYLYVVAYKEQRSFAKLTLTGELVWRYGAPMASGKYCDGEDRFPRAKGDTPRHRDRFSPTNFAFLPDGGFFLADGYGAYCIHRFDANGKYVSSIGQPSGKEKRNGQFNTPHGLWVDARGEVPELVVADRANARLQWFTLAGEHLRTQDGFLLPANIDSQGDTLLVPDLVGRVTLLGPENRVITHLGDNSAAMQADVKYQIRSEESRWQAGKFIHPHDACFDHQGNIYVAEWVARGRVTKLTRMD